MQNIGKKKLFKSTGNSPYKIVLSVIKKIEKA